MTTIKAVFSLAMAASLMAITQPSALAQVTDGGTQVRATRIDVRQVKDDLFDGTEKFANGASDVTEINLDPKMMGMVSGGKNGAGDLARKMKFMVIHTYEYPKAGMYRDEDVEVYRRKLQNGNWSCSVHVKDKSGTTDICSRTAADHEGTEMVILTAEPKELTFIHMSGDMSFSDLSKMGSSMGGGQGLSRRVAPAPPVPPVPPTPGAAPSAPASPK